jgi:tRNA (guanine-N7-)-methyltransferase
VGKNKLSKFADLLTYKNVVQAPVNGAEFHDHPMKGRWAADFFRNNSPLILELGCGKGEYTVSLGEMFPEKNFIGIDIKGARIWTGAKLAIEKGLINVGFLRTKIEVIDNFFDKDEVQEIWLTFPDPRMEKTRRRMTSTGFIEKYRKILADNGVIHLKTDSNFLFQYTNALIEKNHLPVYCRTGNLYYSDVLNDILSIRTYYEKQWIERGIEIKYLAFGPGNVNPLKEPEIRLERDPYRSFGRSARIN